MFSVAYSFILNAVSLSRKSPGGKGKHALLSVDFSTLPEGGNAVALRLPSPEGGAGEVENCF
jgi:hypothetical protein